MKPSKQTLAVMAEWPKVQEFFQTSDGQCFFDDNLARNHARGLEDKAVDKISRKAVAATEDTLDKKPAGKAVQLKSENGGKAKADTNQPAPATKPEGKAAQMKPGTNGGKAEADTNQPAQANDPGQENPNSPGESEAKTQDKE